MKSAAAAIIFFCACAPFQTQAQTQPAAIAIRGAKIVTVSGPVIARGTVVLRNGLIEAAGENPPVPRGALIVDGEGLTVYPGLIDALSTWGLPEELGGRARGGASAAPSRRSQGPEDRPATTSWIKAADEIQPADRRIEAARNAGFTTAVVFPTRGIFAGQGSIIDLAGARARDMVLIPSAGQYISMSRGPAGGFPSSLMGTIAYIRQIYLDAAHYQLVEAAYNSHPRGMKRPDYDRALEGVIESKRILLPANSREEIDRMLHFAQELKQPAIFYGMSEGYRSADLLKKFDASVLVGLNWPEKPREADPEEIELLHTLEVRAKAPTTPLVLKQAGVKFAFYSDGVQPLDLWSAIKKAIDSGLPREDAVRALTLSPAEMYGVADRLGSIENGKIANLVVTRGDLFEEATHVEMVFVDGVRYTPEQRQ